MANERPYRALIERLKAVGLRPTRQRLALARLLHEGGNRHLSAEQLHEEARAAKVRVSLATVYNALHQFTAAGLLLMTWGRLVTCHRNVLNSSERESEATRATSPPYERIGL